MSIEELPENNIFRCLDIAEPLDFIFIPSNEKDLFKGSHNGYAKLKNPVYHSRTVEFEKKRFIWEVSDQLSGEGKHSFKWYFHFGSGIDFEIDQNRVYTKLIGKINLELIFTGEFDKQFKKLRDFVSTSYGVKEPSCTLEISAEERCPVLLRTIIKII